MIRIIDILFKVIRIAIREAVIMLWEKLGLQTRLELWFRLLLTALGRSSQPKLISLFVKDSVNSLPST